MVCAVRRNPCSHCLERHTAATAAPVEIVLTEHHSDCSSTVSCIHTEIILHKFSIKVSILSI